MNQPKRKIAILGSTGSIGTQTLDIASEYPELFQVSLLTAGNNWKLLAEQARRFHPECVVIANKDHYIPLKNELAGTGTEVMAGSQAISDAAGADDGVQTVVTAMVGYSGLMPTISAVKAGKRIALANKETLVAGGELITGLLARYGTDIVPVDSEHSAIFQCLRGETTLEAEKIILTASGGPFRTFTKEQLETVTPADALRHPNWSMGAKVTIDSASMMNKGFEMIEARWLFNCPPEKIEIVVHPQSIVHSMVQFVDGSIKAQLGATDMHLPIRYALGFPHRLPTRQPAITLPEYARLTFEAPDREKFPLLDFAFEAISAGGNTPCALNAANEVAVSSFLAGRLKFTDIPRLIRATLDRVPFIPSPDYDTLVSTNTEAVCIARSLADSPAFKIC